MSENLTAERVESVLSAAGAEGLQAKSIAEALGIDLPSMEKLVKKRTLQKLRSIARAVITEKGGTIKKGEDAFSEAVYVLTGEKKGGE